MYECDLVCSMVNLYRINSGSRKFGVDFVEVNWGNGLSIFGTFERKLYEGFQRLPLDVPLVNFVFMTVQGTIKYPQEKR